MSQLLSSLSRGWKQAMMLLSVWPLINRCDFNLVPYGLTAASNFYSLGTWLDVEYEGVHVVVKVNDRCGACQLDLSYGAFRVLAPHTRGVILVTVE